MPMILCEHDGQWKPMPLVESRYRLAGNPVTLSALTNAGDKEQAGHLLVRDESDGRWALLVRGDQPVLHNGQPVAAGIRVLEHQDALTLAGDEQVYFSSEEPAHVELFQSARATCPRCRRDIVAGQPAVKCSRCSVHHHEDREAGLPCWTYAPTCAMCPQPTTLNGELQWTPAAL